MGGIDKVPEVNYRSIDNSLSLLIVMRGIDKVPEVNYCSINSSLSLLIVMRGTLCSISIADIGLPGISMLIGEYINFLF
jgi:hypothetical protein